MDILAILKERKLRSLQKSISFSEAIDKNVSMLGEHTVQVLNGEVTNNPEEYKLRELYNKILSEYKRTPGFAQLGILEGRGLAMWKRVSKACKSSGVDSEVYIRAQFTYFDRVFRRAPTVVQLTTDAAVLRAQSEVPLRVITNNIDAKIGIADIFKRCEKQMQDVMRAQSMTREEVYSKLVKSGLLIFPKEFINNDPAWKRAQ